ncbi:hypothetical protein A3Q56_08190 [Intoshia linei]|uniref:Uncharacterized protein n=1 Tax=Intoshia linei TaxID=1819745 RepID=A0A177AQ18_9BILA|nr:hypothetical protein A3Q56_08190 [Intoshia linei]
MAEFAKLEKKENTRAIPNVMINLPHSAQIRIKTGIDKIMRKKKSPVKYNPRKLGNNLNKIAEGKLIL